uniref:Reverse transcriptase domain-containing protein n=1 Tax=Tanacetum cinerariifolium TaxID=118510 RepID=A0A699HJE2_TANCI|nr:hypothetical protein [Tanacetum cinerariifolium]
MIIESVENGPLIWPTIKEKGVTRLRKYSELTHAKAIQADCDVKTTNITLQGLPPEYRHRIFNIPLQPRFGGVIDWHLEPRFYREPAVMSSASSAVTYTSVYTDSEPGRVFWGADEELSNGESDLEEDPKEYEDDESEDGLVDYPMDGGDDGDDDDGDSFEDVADDQDEEDEEEEEHLASGDSAVVVPTFELVSLHEGTEPVIPPPTTDITTIGARITIRLQASISLPPKEEVERLLAMPTPPPSPLTSLSPPSVKVRLARCTALSAHSSPPHVPSLFLPSSGCPTQIQTLRIASTHALIDAVTAVLPSLPLYIPPHVDRRDDIPETELPPYKKSCLFALGHSMMPGRVLLLDRPETEMAELRETDRRRQTQMVEILRVIGDMRREMVDIKVELLALREQRRRARQPGSDARVPDHQDASRDTDSRIQNHSSDGDNRRNVQTTPPCFYADFMKRQPLNFKITEGVVGLTQWIEWMESIFQISGCAIENQVKFATCTLLMAALTWWSG